MVDCGEDMIAKGSHDYLIAWAGADGNFYFSSPNRTWAIGAAKRVCVSLEEQERIDQQRRDEDRS